MNLADGAGADLAIAAGARAVSTDRRQPLSI